MQHPSQQRPILASLWMMGALLSISGMAIAGRELSSELNAFHRNVGSSKVKSIRKLAKATLERVR